MLGGEGDDPPTGRAMSGPGGGAGGGAVGGRDQQPAGSLGSGAGGVSAGGGGATTTSAPATTGTAPLTVPVGALSQVWKTETASIRGGSSLKGWSVTYGAGRDGAHTSYERLSSTTGGIGGAASAAAVASSAASATSRQGMALRPGSPHLRLSTAGAEHSARPRAMLRVANLVGDIAGVNDVATADSVPLVRMPRSYHRHNEYYTRRSHTSIGSRAPTVQSMRETTTSTLLPGTGTATAAEPGVLVEVDKILPPLTSLNNATQGIRVTLTEQELASLSMDARQVERIHRLVGLYTTGLHNLVAELGGASPRLAAKAWSSAVHEVEQLIGAALESPLRDLAERAEQQLGSSEAALNLARARAERARHDMLVFAASEARDALHTAQGESRQVKQSLETERRAVLDKEAQYREELEKRRLAEEEISDLVALPMQLSSFAKRIHHLNKDKEVLEARAQAAETRLQKAQRDMKRLSRELKLSQKKMRTRDEELSAAERSLAEMTTQVSTIRRENQTILREVCAKQDEMNANLEQTQRLEAKLRELENDNLAQEKEIAQSAREIARLTEVSGRADLLEEQLAQSVADNQAKELMLVDARESLERAQQEKAEAHEETESARAEKDGLMRELAGTNAELRSVLQRSANERVRLQELEVVLKTAEEDIEARYRDNATALEEEVRRNCDDIASLVLESTVNRASTAAADRKNALYIASLTEEKAAAQKELRKIEENARVLEAQRRQDMETVNVLRQQVKTLKDSARSDGERWQRTRRQLHGDMENMGIDLRSATQAGAEANVTIGSLSARIEELEREKEELHTNISGKDATLANIHHSVNERFANLEEKVEHERAMRKEAEESLTLVMKELKSSMRAHAVAAAHAGSSSKERRTMLSSSSATAPPSKVSRATVTVDEAEAKATVKLLRQREAQAAAEAVDFDDDDGFLGGNSERKKLEQVEANANLMKKEEEDQREMEKEAARLVQQASETKDVAVLESKTIEDHASTIRSEEELTEARRKVATLEFRVSALQQSIELAQAARIDIKVSSDDGSEKEATTTVATEAIVPAAPSAATPSGDGTPSRPLSRPSTTLPTTPATTSVVHIEGLFDADTANVDDLHAEITKLQEELTQSREDLHNAENVRRRKAERGPSSDATVVVSQSVAAASTDMDGERAESSESGATDVSANLIDESTSTQGLAKTVEVDEAVHMSSSASTSSVTLQLSVLGGSESEGQTRAETASTHTSTDTSVSIDMPTPTPTVLSQSMQTAAQQHVSAAPSSLQQKKSDSEDTLTAAERRHAESALTKRPELDTTSVGTETTASMSPSSKVTMNTSTGTMRADRVESGAQVQAPGRSPSVEPVLRMTDAVESEDVVRSTSPDSIASFDMADEQLDGFSSPSTHEILDTGVRASTTRLDHERPGTVATTAKRSAPPVSGEAAQQSSLPSALSPRSAVSVAKPAITATESSSSVTMVPTTQPHVPSTSSHDRHRAVEVQEVDDAQVRVERHHRVDDDNVRIVQGADDVGGTGSVQPSEPHHHHEEYHHEGTASAVDCQGREATISTHTASDGGAESNAGVQDVASPASSSHQSDGVSAEAGGAYIDATRDQDLHASVESMRDAMLALQSCGRRIENLRHLMENGIGDANDDRRGEYAALELRVGPGWEVRRLDALFCEHGCAAQLFLSLRLDVARKYVSRKQAPLYAQIASLREPVGSTKTKALVAHIMSSIDAMEEADAEATATASAVVEHCARTTNSRKERVMESIDNFGALSEANAFREAIQELVVDIEFNDAISTLQKSTFVVQTSMLEDHYYELARARFGALEYLRDDAQALKHSSEFLSRSALVVAQKAYDATKLLAKESARHYETRLDALECGVELSVLAASLEEKERERLSSEVEYSAFVLEDLAGISGGESMLSTLSLVLAGDRLRVELFHAFVPLVESFFELVNGTASKKIEPETVKAMKKQQAKEIEDLQKLIVASFAELGEQLGGALTAAIAQLQRSEEKLVDVMLDASNYNDLEYHMERHVDACNAKRRTVESLAYAMSVYAKEADAMSRLGEVLKMDSLSKCQHYDDMILVSSVKALIEGVGISAKDATDEVTHVLASAITKHDDTVQLWVQQLTTEHPNLMTPELRSVCDSCTLGGSETVIAKATSALDEDRATAVNPLGDAILFAHMQAQLSVTDDVSGVIRHLVSIGRSEVRRITRVLAKLFSGSFKHQLELRLREVEESTVEWNMWLQSYLSSASVLRKNTGEMKATMMRGQIHASSSTSSVSSSSSLASGKPTTLTSMASAAGEVPVLHCLREHYMYALLQDFDAHEHVWTGVGIFLQSHLLCSQSRALVLKCDLRSVERDLLRISKVISARSANVVEKVLKDKKLQLEDLSDKLSTAKEEHEAQESALQDAVNRAKEAELALKEQQFAVLGMKPPPESPSPPLATAPTGDDGDRALSSPAGQKSDGHDMQEAAAGGGGRSMPSPATRSPKPGTSDSATIDPARSEEAGAVDEQSASVTEPAATVADGQSNAPVVFVSVSPDDEDVDAGDGDLRNANFVVSEEEIEDLVSSLQDSTFTLDPFDHNSDIDVMQAGGHPHSKSNVQRSFDHRLLEEYSAKSGCLFPQRAYCDDNGTFLVHLPRRAGKWSIRPSDTNSLSVLAIGGLSADFPGIMIPPVTYINRKEQQLTAEALRKYTFRSSSRLSRRRNKTIENEMTAWLDSHTFRRERLIQALVDLNVASNLPYDHDTNNRKLMLPLHIAKLVQKYVMKRRKLHNEFQLKSQKMGNTFNSIELDSSLYHPTLLRTL